MTMSLFDQFLSPNLCGLNLLPITIILPAVLSPLNSRVKLPRVSALVAVFFKMALKHLLVKTHPTTAPWAPLLISTTILVSSANILGLLPYTPTPTTQLSMNLALAVPLWLGTVLLGLQKQPAHFLAHLLPEGTPTPLIPILIIIETVSLFIRPLALGIRLTANMTAGHLLIHLISAAAMNLDPTLYLISTIMLWVLMILEAAVALIQAYVFVMLLSLYLREATDD